MIKMNTKRGFTLIELLVVIAIVSLLSSIVMSSVRTARVKAKLTAIQQNLISLRTQAEIFRAANGGRYSTIGVSEYDNNCIKTSTGFPFLDDPVIKKTLNEITKLSGGKNPSSVDYLYCEFGEDYFRIRMDMWNIGGIPTSICMSNNSSAYANVSFDDGYLDGSSVLPLCTPNL